MTTFRYPHTRAFFVADVPAEAEEAMERKAAPAVQGADLQKVMDLVADLMSMPQERIIGSGKSPDQVKARTRPDYDRRGQRFDDFSTDLPASLPEEATNALECGYSLMDLLDTSTTNIKI